jgi:hypothetical protein
MWILFQCYSIVSMQTTLPSPRSSSGSHYRHSKPKPKLEVTCHEGLKTCKGKSFFLTSQRDSEGGRNFGLLFLL